MPASKLSLVPFGSEPIEKLKQSIIDGKSGDALSPVTVIVPNQYAGISLRRALSTQAGLVNVRFMVLPRLAEYLGSPRLASEGRIPMTPLVELAAIREASGIVTDGGPLTGVAGHPLLHASLSRSFRQLDHLTEDQLSELKNIDHLRSQIVDWHQRFLDLTLGFYSEGMLYRAAAEAVRDGTSDAALRDLGFIIFYMIQDLSLSERPLIDHLAALGRSALILGLSGETGPDKWTRELAGRTTHILGPADEISSSNHSLEADQIVSAPDAQEEVRWVVRNIVKQAEEGARFSRMAVLYHQGGPYESLIASQFGLAGIPIAGPSPISLSDTPAGRLILLFMNVLDSGYSRESIMQWISESPVRPRIESSFTSAQAAEWDLISRNAGIVGGLEQWTGRLRRYAETILRRIAAAEDVEESTPAKLQGLRQLGAAAVGLSGFIARLPRSAPPESESSWNAYVDWAKGLLTEHGPDLQEWAEQVQSGFDRVCEALDDIRGLDVVSDTTDLAGFRSVLEDALQVSSGRIGATGTGVLSASVSTAVSMDLDHVYILGMAEGSFPRARADDPMLPEEVCETVGNGGFFISREHTRMRDRREFMAAMACAGRLFATYPRTDPSAQRGQHPSPWLLELAASMNGSPVTSTELPKLKDEPWITWIDSSEDGLRTANDLAHADLHDYDVDSVARWRRMGQPLGLHYLAEDQSSLDRCLSLEAGRDSSELSAWDGGLVEISGDGSSFLGTRSAVFSATRLERWSVCPYRYFLGDVLGLSALEAPEELLTISPLDRGTLVHRILERFVRSVIEADTVPDAGQSWSPDHRSLLSLIAEEEFADAEAKGITGRPLIWSVSKEALMADLEAFLESDDLWRSETGCRPVWVERRFGFEGDPDSLPPVVLKLDNSQEIRLRGVIDRVDIDPSGRRAVVTDYKTGRSTAYRDMNKDPLGSGKHLQLPIYGMAVRDALAALQEVDSQYWFISTAGRFEHRVVSLAEVEEDMGREAGRIVSAINQGVFPAIPGQPDQSGGPENCRYCEFDKVCPSNRDVLWDRKQSSLVVRDALGQFEDQGDSDETTE